MNTSTLQEVGNQSNWQNSGADFIAGSVHRGIVTATEAHTTHALNSKLIFIAGSVHIGTSEADITDAVFLAGPAALTPLPKQHGLC